MVGPRTMAFEFDARVDHTSVAPDTATELRCLFELRSENAIAEAVTTSIVLVFDCSGSMAGKKREAAIAAAKMIVEKIHERHKISLVGFGTKVRMFVDNEQATAKARDAIKAKIDKLRDFERGRTNLAEGIKRGANLVKGKGADAKVMVILSDGGADDERAALDAARRATKGGIQIFAVGIGDDFEADRLLGLVTPSNGTVLGESDVDKIGGAFENILGRIESFVATNAEIAITLAAGARPGQAYKTSPEQAFIGDLEEGAPIVLHVGNVERGRMYGFLVSLTTPKKSSGKLEIARAELRYDVPSMRLRDQRKEAAITIAFDGKSAADDRVSIAFRGAEMARLAQELAEAQRKKDDDRCVEIADLLVRLADEHGDEKTKAHYKELLAGFKKGERVSQKKINAAIVASTEKRASKPKMKGAKLYDVVLVEPGDSLILLMRELRDLTGKNLREIQIILDSSPSAIGEALALIDATALKKRVEKTGARLEVRPSLAPR